MQLQTLQLLQQTLQAQQEHRLLRFNLMLHLLFLDNRHLHLLEHSNGLLHTQPQYLLFASVEVAVLVMMSLLLVAVEDLVGKITSL